MSRHYLACLRLLVCGYDTPCEAVVMLRCDLGFEAKILLVIYVAGPDVNVLSRLVCIGALDDNVLCFCLGVYFGEVGLI